MIRFRPRFWSVAPVQPGTIGHLFLFAWSLAIVMLAPAARTPVAALLALLAAACLTPGAIRRVLRPRWLLLLALMALPSLFLPGPPALSLGGVVTISAVGLQTALRTLLRALIILVAVDGLTSSVEVSQIAALFERAGFKGLGFALGIALNMLPILRETTTVTWHSLRMRQAIPGSPFAPRLRLFTALRYFLVTVIGNALRRSANIALAAEARAYNPQNSHPPVLQTSPLDRPLVLIMTLILIALLLA